MAKESFRENLSLLRSTRAVTLKMIAHLTQEQFSFRPSPDTWSLGEILDHLIVVERFWGDKVAELIDLEKAGEGKKVHVELSALEPGLPFVPKSLVPYLQLPSRILNMLLPEKVRDFAMENRPVAVEAPAAFLPTYGKSRAELTSGLQAALGETVALFDSNPDLDFDGMTADHPLLGKASAAKEPAVVALHERRHQNQMRGIMSHPDFPSRTESVSTEEKTMPHTDDESSFISLSQRVNLLYDHYKQGTQVLERHIIWRARIVIAFVFLVFTMILQISSPELAARITEKLSGVPLESLNKPNLQLLNSALWFALTIVVIGLYSRSISIVQQAFDLRRMKTRLVEYMPKECLGHDLGAERIHRRFFDKADLSYQLLTAILLGAVLLLKLDAEFGSNEIFFFVDVGFAFVILYFSVEAIIWQRNLMSYVRVNG